MQFKEVVFSLLLFIAFCTSGLAQQDSLHYWVKEFRKPGLTASQKQVIGQKIVTIQKQRYYAAFEKQEEEPVENYLWIDSIALLPALFDELNDSILAALSTIALDTDVRKEVRLNALNIIAALNSPLSDLFLLEKMSDIIHLEYTEGGDDELFVAYPCFALLITKAPNNWGLINPIFKSLQVEKTADELSLIAFLLWEISDVTTALRIVDFHLERAYGNELVSNNLNQIKQLILQK